MNLNGINLVEYNNRYMLVDYSASKPIIISKRVYIILSKVKKGIPIDILKGEYGENLVNTIESTINDLKVRKVIECSDKSFYEEGKKEICKYQEQDIDLLEGNMMISQDSNMACTYCYGGASGTYNQKGLMSIEMAEKYFRYFISSGGKRKFQKLVFFWWRTIIKYASNKTYCIDMGKNKTPSYWARDVFHINNKWSLNRTRNC